MDAVQNCSLVFDHFHLEYFLFYFSGAHGNRLNARYITSDSMFIEICLAIRLTCENEFVETCIDRTVTLLLEYHYSSVSERRPFFADHKFKLNGSEQYFGNSEYSLYLLLCRSLVVKRVFQLPRYREGSPG